MEKIVFSSLAYANGFAEVEFFVSKPNGEPSNVLVMIGKDSLELKDYGKMWKVDLDLYTTDFGHVSYKTPKDDRELTEELVAELFPELSVTPTLTTLIYFSILGSIARATNFEWCQKFEGDESTEFEGIASKKVEYITDEAPLPFVHMETSFSSLKDGIVA